MTRKSRIFVVGLTLLLVTVMAAQPLLARKKRRGTGYEGPDPCARLTSALVTDALGKAPSAKVEQQRGRFATEVCTLTWKKPNAAALEEEMTRNMMGMMAARMKAQAEGKKPPKMKIIRTENEVTITYSRVLYKKKKEARAAYESAMRTLNKGITRSATIKVHNGTKREVTSTFQADSNNISGVGDAAAWIPKQHQLAVLDGRGYFYVIANFSDDAASNKKIAVAIAKKMLSGKGGRP